MKRILYTAAAAAAVLAGSAAMAAPAMASNGPGTVTAVTHLNNHPDTTNVAVQGRTDNVWAYDNATEKFTLVQQPDGSWNVTMDYVGSFHGFADPTLGTTLDSTGSVKGTISYQVTSGSTPNPALLPGQSAPDAHISTNIRALFGNDPSTVINGGDVYSFSYQNGNYTQIASPALVISGDVQGH
jgi:hypothetical protein